MTVETIKLGRNEGGEMVYKCFYGEEFSGPFGYGEFYVNIDEKRHIMRFASKDLIYAEVLVAAFELSMHE